MEQIIEYKKTYQEYKAELDAELAKSAEGFVRIGYLLKVARDTDILSESGYATVTDFAKAEYNIDKTLVSRFIHINDKFSEGGYSDRLEERYRKFGYAKLVIMLQLPDEINEELTPEFSKSDIQTIKDEVDAEKRITDIEVALEGETESTAVMKTDLGKTVKQLGEDEPQIYADIWTAIRQQDWSIETLQAILAPAGEKVYSVRIRGVGRKEMLVKDKDNGNKIILIDLRGAGKMWYSWEDMLQVWESITSPEPETGYKGAWETTYFAAWPLEEKIAPVQQQKKEKRKDSKVTKAKTKERSQEKQPAAVVQEKPTEEQLPGQMTVEDYPEIIPTSYEEIKEEDTMEDTKNADGGAEYTEGGGDPSNQGSVNGNEGAVQSDAEGCSDAADDADVVPGGLGAAGDAGTSQEISRIKNVDIIDAWDALSEAFTEVLDTDATIKEIQRAYDRAIDLAAAIEKILIARQREAAKQDG